MFEIKNVTDLSGNVMKVSSTTQKFVENVAPSLVSAKLTSNETITLTFSEAMKTDSIVEGTPVADFDVFIDGTKESGVVEASKDSKTFTLKLSDALKLLNLVQQSQLSQLLLSMLRIQMVPATQHSLL